jgi:hypothetical protein
MYTFASRRRTGLLEKGLHKPIQLTEYAFASCHSTGKATLVNLYEHSLQKRS